MLTLDTSLYFWYGIHAGSWGYGAHSGDLKTELTEHIINCVNCTSCLVKYEKIEYLLSKLFQIRQLGTQTTVLSDTFFNVLTGIQLYFKQLKG